MYNAIRRIIINFHWDNIFNLKFIRRLVLHGFISGDSRNTWMLSRFDGSACSASPSRKFRLFPTKDMQIPPPPPSVLIRFLWMMRNVLKRMKNQFFDFYFSNHRENFIENWGTKMTITQK